MPHPVNRRHFLKVSSGLMALPMISRAREDASGPFQAMGTRVGDVTENSAIVWTRLTSAPLRNNAGLLIHGRYSDGKQQVKYSPLTVPVESLEGACPGVSGRVRLRYGTREDGSDAKTLEWIAVGQETDFIHHFALSGLSPSTVYHYLAEATSAGSAEPRSSFHGSFETATAADQATDLSFCVMTCQAYPDRDHPDGHNIYPSMLALKPRFAVLSGDLVYYDNDAPRAENPVIARFHWERMFSLPRLIEFSSRVATYWQKDDHDCLKNDSWAGQKLGDFTFTEGGEIFKQQAPIGQGVTYRTVRWGRDLQLWFTEGRDYRSPNNIPDGPEKTIWGAEQKAWFKRTVMESPATWKILISPTPIIGPDRASGKSDNHTNSGFQHEGDELRQWMQQQVPENFFILCGDRHWQYDSIHPVTKVREFCCGPASDEHAGGSPGENQAYHQFHRQLGGFLSVTLHPEGATSHLKFEMRDVMGKVLHQVEFQRPHG